MRASLSDRAAEGRLDWLNKRLVERGDLDAEAWRDFESLQIDDG